MATASAPPRLVAGGDDGRRGPPPRPAASGPGRARRRQALVVEARCAGADLSPTRPTATASSVTGRRGKTNQEGEDAGRAVREGGRRPGRLPTARPEAGGNVRGRLTWPPSSSPTTGAAGRAGGVESEKRSRSKTIGSTP